MREQQLHQLRQQIIRAANNLREWFRNKPQTQRRLISGGLGLVVVAILAVVAAIPAITNASELDALGNGGFERGFHDVSGCGAVGNNWDCFTNGGAAAYGFYDDQWEKTVFEGKHSQLIEINTKNMAAGDNDRYAGISQTTKVVPGAPYKLSLHGMIRSTNSEGDPWRYSVQVGWLNEPQGDWRDVTNWTDVGWNTYFSRTEPGAFSAFETRFVPDSEFVTVFIRVWKKWGVAYEELDVNLDAISLTGPAVNYPQGGQQHDGDHYDGEYHDGDHSDGNHYDGVGGPLPGQEYKPEQFNPQGGPNQGPQNQGPENVGPQNNGPQNNGPENYGHDDSDDFGPVRPSDDASLSCGGPDLLYNGSFEAGFNGVPWGKAAKGWDAFTNGGAANYGFYDEQWDIVVADGNHGQLIEINSKAVYPTDADRYAGLAQQVGGLHPGATYELTVHGELRGVGNEDDPYRFAAQWGVGSENNWQSVDEWTTMDLGPIAVREQPVPLATYKVRFEAPAQSIVLFIRGWKKFAITNVEMDFNLDAISLRACDGKGPQKQGGYGPQQYPGTGGPVNQPGNQGYPDRDDHQGGYPNGPQGEPQGGYNDGTQCLYVVRPGDTLSQIAVDAGVSMDALIRANGIDDPSAIYVGQKFEIPGCDRAGEDRDSDNGHDQGNGPDNRQSYNQPGPVQEYQITQGERPDDSAMRTGPTMRPSAEDHDSVEQPQAYQEQAGPQRQSGPVTYTVQEGDMLSAIAEQYGVNAYELATSNGIDNLNFIYAGEVLVIPN